MLTELCRELHNWFERERRTGTFNITDEGNIDVDFLSEGQYFRIMGSTFSDGVHKYPASDLHPETFTGAVWALAIPKSVIKLSEDIEAWQDKYGPDSAAMSPFSSESFGGYSYSKGGSASSGGSAAGASWRDAFASRLNAWRKMQ